MLRLLCRQAVQTGRSSLAGVQTLTTRNLTVDKRPVNPKVEEQLLNEFSTIKCNILGRISFIGEDTGDYRRYNVVAEGTDFKSSFTCFQFKNNTRQSIPQIGDRYMISGVCLLNDPQYGSNVFIRTKNATLISRKRVPKPQVE